MDHQPGVIDSMQSRAGLAASASVIALSLAASQGTLETAWAWPILGVFAVVLVAVAYVLWPVTVWRFNFEPDVVLAQYVEGPTPLRPDLMKRDLALHLGNYARSNAVHIDRMSKALAASLVGLLAETVLVVLSLS